MSERIIEHYIAGVDCTVRVVLPEHTKKVVNGGIDFANVIIVECSAKGGYVNIPSEIIVHLGFDPLAQPDAE
jgi:hypothetical protein